MNFKNSMSKTLAFAEWRYVKFNSSFVVRSTKINSHGDYQKDKERIQELKVLWKNEKLQN